MCGNDPEERPDEKTRARSCCGCAFFLMTIWIWVGLGWGIYQNAIVQRKVYSSVDATWNGTLICGWSSRRLATLPTDSSNTNTNTNPPTTSETNYKDACSQDQKLCSVMRNGSTYFGLLMATIPFGCMLAFSCCLAYGTKEELEEKDGVNFKRLSVNERKKYDALMLRRSRTHRAVKIVGMVGVFAFELGAVLAFQSSQSACTEPLSTAAVMAINSAEPANYSFGGPPSMGISAVLILSALAVTLVLILIVIMLIVILTSEDANSVGFAGAALGFLNCLSCNECPECTGAFACDGGADVAASDNEGCCAGIAACICGICEEK